MTNHAAGGRPKPRRFSRYQLRVDLLNVSKRIRGSFPGPTAPLDWRRASLCWPLTNRARIEALKFLRGAVRTRKKKHTHDKSAPLCFAVSI
jgi:hypothetical protein